MNKIILVQIGARHRYVIPKMLYDNGILKYLYTDSSNKSLLGFFASIFKSLNSSANKLSNRKIEGIPNDFIKSTDVIFFKSIFRKNTRFKLENLWNHKIFSKKAIKWGVEDADAIYQMYIENLDFIKFAKSKKLKIITDIYISPLTESLMIQEHMKHPFLKNVNYNIDDNKIYEKKVRETIELSDVLLCPSKWVADGVIEFDIRAKDKVKIVPYGSSISFSNVVNKPIKGRVLFVGYDISRKGLIYLGMAASILKNKNFDFRVAGLERTGELCNNVFQELNFLGKLDYASLKKEYESADVFILPSFSEGLAGVLVEAMSAGLPIIATKNSGIEIQNEEDGLVIKPGDVEDIVTAVNKIYNNRELRNKLAEKALINSEKYSIMAWEKRLVKVLQEI